MTAMSKRARRRRLRRLRAFERKHAPEMARLERLVEAYRQSAIRAKHERDVLSAKLRQLGQALKSVPLAKAPEGSILPFCGGLILPVRFEVE